jgi:hypothetical protein
VQETKIYLATLQLCITLESTIADAPNLISPSGQTQKLSRAPHIEKTFWMLLNPTNFLPIKFIPCKNGTLRSKKQLLLCLLSFEGVQRGNISGIQEKSNRQTTETVCV